ncbi:hypothetical protein LBMAG18_10020 [Alphaproteobacteria bacterium]|nr:hypothetical protein LBMAG18_10020 [Alphaproteobacteria bacterium]
MKKILNNHKAFSLIELSVVILIIGILVAGVTSSSRLVKRMKLVTAQNITNTSPILTIKDLVLWYETTLERSFIDTEEQDNSDLSFWYDNNIQTTNKINAYAPAVANRPKFIENGINGLPVLRLAGGDDYMIIDNPGITGSQFTYIFVLRRNVSVSETAVFSGTNLSGTYDYDHNENLCGFYEGAGAIITPFRVSGLSFVNHPGNSIPYIITSIFNGSNNILYLNGNPSTPVASSGNFNFKRIYLGVRWALNGGTWGYYNGDIAEIIFFNRALNTEERVAIERYLSKKFAIKIV